MKKILAVEDDPETRKYYTALLSEEGYEVSTAEDATGGVIQFRSFKPDLVILDVEMPGGGGEKVFEIVREIMESGVPVLFVTGLPERVEGLIRVYPGVKLLAKPAGGDDLLACVADLLGRPAGP
ncbi:MAG: response regulator [Elusimicrobiales bacterium]|nr:response regulator [Elusimicrobiales bacterium]